MIENYDQNYENITSKNLYLAPWEQTKWLVLSSYFFIIPSVYSYFKQLYFYSILLLFTSIISANYWRKATYSWRRNSDIFVSKISFVIFTYNGFGYINYTPYIIIAYPALLISIYFFYMSNKLFTLNNNNWYKYHFMFHFFITCATHIAVMGFSRNNQIKNQIKTEIIQL